MSASAGPAVEAEVSITIATSNFWSWPRIASARPATKTPQAELPTTAPSGGYSISSWRFTAVAECGSTSEGRESAACLALLPGSRASEAGFTLRLAASEANCAKGWPAPPASGRSSAARMALSGARITRVVEPCG